ncbi:hypothetical protein CLAIMM_06555 [Cladophialophora immunda]|nr:hypothetical protein CLAIMM_06555 [Cladophialophora immunda]
MSRRVADSSAASSTTFSAFAAQSWRHHSHGPYSHQKCLSLSAAPLKDKAFQERWFARNSNSRLSTFTLAMVL